VLGAYDTPWVSHGQRRRAAISGAVNGRYDSRSATLNAAASSPTAVNEVLLDDSLIKTGALQRAIFNSANFSSIATDAKGVIQIFNVGAERMLGYTAAM